MAQRDNAYGAFNFLLRLGTIGGQDQIVGGFSEVSGLGNEADHPEYRNRKDRETHVRKAANTDSTHEVTLKRGVIGDLRLSTWLRETLDGADEPQTVTITLLDVARAPVCSWILQSAQPKKWIGPTLAEKGAGEVAMEELSLVAERIDFESR